MVSEYVIAPSWHLFFQCAGFHCHGRDILGWFYFKKGYVTESCAAVWLCPAQLLGTARLAVQHSEWQRTSALHFSLPINFFQREDLHHDSLWSVSAKTHVISG